MHKILLQQKHNELQNIWTLYYRGYFPLQILAQAEEIVYSPSVHSKIIYAALGTWYRSKRTGFELPFL